MFLKWYGDDQWQYRLFQPYRYSLNIILQIIVLEANSKLGLCTIYKFLLRCQPRRPLGVKTKALYIENWLNNIWRCTKLIPISSKFLVVTGSRSQEFLVCMFPRTPEGDILFIESLPTPQTIWAFGSDQESSHRISNCGSMNHANYHVKFGIGAKMPKLYDVVYTY